MESGGRSSRRRRYATRTSAPGIVIGATRNRRTHNRNMTPDRSSRRRADQYLPMANVIQIMRRILPAHASIDDDAKQAIQECVSKFIRFITSEANNQCQQDSRSTVTPTDVLSAMNTLGFHNYVEPLTIFLNNYRAQDLDLDHSSMHHGSFVSHPTSYMQEPVAQMAISPFPPTFVMGYGLTQQPASQMVRPPPSTMGYGLSPLHAPQLAPQPSFSMGHRQPQLPVDHSNYVRFPSLADYFMANQGGGEGSSSGRGV